MGNRKELGHARVLKTKAAWERVASPVQIGWQLENLTRDLNLISPTSKLLIGGEAELGGGGMSK